IRARESRISQCESKVAQIRDTLGCMKKTPAPGPAPDRDLGEGRRIPRRDFVQGALVAAATTLSGPLLKAYAGVLEGPQDTPGYYPPVLTGMRGSQPGSFEDAHALRDGRE